MMHIHRLEGCSPTPLAHYLKALGILRLVAEQADPDARGWWAGESFCLATKLSQAELERFFLTEYKPAPLVSPWNKGSGFFYENDPALGPVKGSTAVRFHLLREGIRASEELLEPLLEADSRAREIKEEAKSKELSASERKALRESDDYKKRLNAADKRFKELKAEFLPKTRIHWRGPHSEWLDVALVINDEGKPLFPALLGTGGNDGRLDFTNNYYQRIADLFAIESDTGEARGEAAGWLNAALWGTAVPNIQRGKAVGQYLPGTAGGANATVGPDGDSLLNPFDFVLMLEGTLLFAAHATKRLATGAQSRAAAPFTIHSQAVGYPSAGESDESARGEQWMPLWDRPVTFRELKRLLAEGRSQIGAKPASEPLDLARAIARLGTARGISAFQRYGYIERNGQANLAVPLGRFRVPDQIEPRLECLDDLEAWLGRLRREARDKHAPNRLRIAEHRLAESLLEITRHPTERGRWQTALLHLAEAEAVILTNPKSRVGKLPPLRPAWVQAADDGAAELRLACAFALQAGHFYKDGGAASPVRNHWVARKNEETDRVMRGRSGLGDAIAVVERRLITAARQDRRRLPLLAAPKAYASLTDLAALIAGEVDLDRTLALARALMALDSRQWAADPRPPVMPGDHAWPDDAWCLLRLAMLPWPVEDHAIPADPALFRRLSTGDAGQAVVIARRRLRAAGIVPTIRGASLPPQTARRWAAAMAFPIVPFQAKQLLRRLDPNTITEE